MKTDKASISSMESVYRNIELVMPSEMSAFIRKEGSRQVSLPPFHDRFTLHRIEDFRSIHKLPIPPHRKPVCDFIFLTQGKSIRYRNMDGFEVLPNDMFFLPAYQVLTKEEMSEDIHGFYCHFDLEIFTRSLIKKDFTKDFPFLQSTGYPVLSISNSKQGEVLSILHRLEKIYRCGKQPDFGLICSYLLSLFLEIKEFAVDDQVNVSDAASQITRDYKNALSNYIYRYHRISEFAAHLSITPNYLNRCVNMTTGRTARDLLFEMILLEAKVLLKQTNLSISAIAYKLGKKAPSDFTRFFRSKTGVTPKQYRES